MTADCGASVNEWVNIIRRAKLDRTTKLVGLTLASYADPDGTKVYPGLDRLVVECRIGYGTARRALSTLRTAALIEQVGRGNRRRGRSDEYRLIIGPELLDRVDVLSPDEHRLEIEATAERRRAVANVRHQRWRKDRSTLTEDSLNTRETVANQTSSTLTQTSVDDEFNAHYERLSTLTTDPPPSIETSPNSESVDPGSPSIHSAASASASTVVDGEGSAGAASTRVDGRLDLAEMDGTKNGHRRSRHPFKDIQDAYDEGRIDEEDVLEWLGDKLLGWHGDDEERTALGMLGSGAHVRAIFNKIRKDRT